MIRRMLLLLLFFSFGVSAAAQNKPTFRIGVKVEGEGGLELDAYICLCRELRSLNDVEVVDTKPTYTIHAIVMKHQPSGSNKVLGIAISWLTLYHIAVKSPRVAVVNHELENPSVVAIVDHQLWSGGPDSLTKKCEEYIAHINSDILEPNRKLLQKVRKP